MEGIQGIIDSYTQTIKTVSFDSKTRNFHNMIEFINDWAASSKDSSKSYKVLIILTNGPPDDTSLTINQLIRA